MEVAPWSPKVPASIPASTRPGGLISGATSAWFGTAERAAGVALTPRQIVAMTGLMTSALGMKSDAVRGVLERVRVQVGGPAEDAGNVATTIGVNVYVSDAAHAARILSWHGRRWLAHELAHTMQWVREPGRTDAQRDRSFLGTYLDGFVADGSGKLGKGGLLAAWKEFQRRQDTGEPGGNLGDLLHDAHPMERQAAKVALEMS